MLVAYINYLLLYKNFKSMKKAISRAISETKNPNLNKFKSKENLSCCKFFLPFALFWVVLSSKVFKLDFDLKKASFTLLHHFIDEANQAVDDS